VIFDPSMSKIGGVLDWEMATIGDPWMDLGTSLSYWMEATDPALFQTPLFGVTSRPGM
jgi:aminoglycoside phosphotransferase (APT) family kinase protein